jgi:tripartite-type tricarboxylate transporter receptor subunit TctC
MLRTLTTLVAFAAAALAGSASLAEAKYPERAVRIIVPYTPGGTVDVLARALAPRLHEALGQPFVIENRPGAGGSIGAEVVAKAPPDGYTLYIATNAPFTTNIFIQKVNYDPLRDFEPVVLTNHSSLLIVANPKLPANTIMELIALAKTTPGGLSAGTSGIGTTAHLALVQLNKVAGVNIVNIPHRGGVPSLQAAVAGDVQITFSDIVPAMPLVKEGLLKAVATTGKKRAVIAPDVPTVSESGLPDFDISAWVGIAAPAGTPKEIVETLNREVNKALQDPEFRKKLIAIGIDAAGGTVEEFRAYLRAEIPRWKQIVSDAGLLAK